MPASPAQQIVDEAVAAANAQPVYTVPPGYQIVQPGGPGGIQLIVPITTPPPNTPRSTPPVTTPPQVTITPPTPKPALPAVPTAVPQATAGPSAGASASASAGGEAVLPSVGQCSVGVAWPALVGGQWVPICEQREGRRSLMVCLVDGWCVLSPSTGAPLVQTATYGLIPAGIFLGSDVGNGPGVFRLQYHLDGCMTEYEWFAWLPAGSPGQTVVWQDYSSGTFTVPDGATNITVTAGGGGGGSWSALPASNISTGGGGGGAIATSSDPALVPGLYTYVVDPGGPADSAVGGGISWVSQTGVAPLTAADGCMAVGGGSAGAAGINGGAGGLGAACIPPGPQDGGDGASGTDASAIPTGASGGGGGYGAMIGSGYTLAAAGGPIGPGPVTGGLGGFNGFTAGNIVSIGGIGGADDTSVPADGASGSVGAPPNVAGGSGGGGAAYTDGGTTGAGATGGTGQIMISYTPPGGMSGLLTVIESFRPQQQSVPPATFSASLPTLDAAGLAALHSLMKKVAAAQTPTPGSQ